jgi:hypothetical protein
MSTYFELKTIKEFAEDNYYRQTRQNENESELMPDDWIKYVEPVINYAMSDSNQQGAVARLLCQKCLLLGILVGLGATPEEAISQVQEWQSSGVSQILGGAGTTGGMTGTTGGTGMTGATGGMTGTTGGTGMTGATGGMTGTTGGTGMTGTTGGMTGTTGGTGTTGTTGGMKGTAGGTGTTGTTGGMTGTTGGTGTTGTTGGYRSSYGRDRLFFD